MRRKATTIGIAAAAALATTGCWEGAIPAGPADATDVRFELIEDEGVLALRVRERAYLLDVDTAILGGGPAVEASIALRESGAEFTLVAEVEPPTVAGQQLQATHVSLTGNRAYVSYGKRGSAALAAIDVFSVSNPESPRLIASARFDDTDIFTISADGGALFCGENSSDPSFASSAVIERVALSGGRMSTSTTRNALASFATTGVDVHGGEVFVTTGNSQSGGLFRLHAKTLEVLASDNFTDARDVDRGGAWLVAVQGQPGRLRIYDTKTLELLNTVSIGGLSIRDSKASVVLDGSYAFVSTGDAGTAIVDLRQAAVVATVPRPSVEGLKAGHSVTNAVAVQANLLMHANGGAGVWLTETKHLSNNPTVTPLGRLVFPDGGSANFVASKGKMLFVAGGEGGLKIVRIRL